MAASETHDRAGGPADHRSDERRDDEAPTVTAATPRPT
jgi:hypothetical protein